MGCGASSKKKKKYEQKPGAGGAAKQVSFNEAGGEAKQEGSASSSTDREKYLSKVPLFQRLPKDEFPALAKAAEPVKFKSGDVIIKEGDEGNEFYIIEKGTAEVHQKDHPGKVHKLTDGDFFGEKALLRDVPRNATIKASGALEALKISREAFVKFGLHDKLNFKNRGAIGGGDEAKVEAKTPSPKTAEETKLMCDALVGNKAISSIIRLDDAVVQQIVGVMWKEQVKKGEVVIQQGESNADYFYIVQSGQFEVVLQRDKEDEEGRRRSEGVEVSMVTVGTLGPGMSFGELALLYQAPRAATISATEDSIVWVIDRMQFKSTLKSGSDQLIHEYATYLNKVDNLSSLTADEKLALARALNEMCFGENEFVFRQGEDGDLFYILLEGEAAVVIDEKEVDRLRATQVEKPFFGELALMKHEPRKASIKIVSPSATTLAIDKVSFDMLLGPLEELAQRAAGGQVTKKSQQSAKEYGQIVYKDLRPLGLLGCGGFGAVSMVEHKKTGDTYALKQLSKGYIIKIGMQRCVTSEKDVQLLCDSPFVINLYETFNGKTYLYLLLELALGGELYATYNKKHLWKQEPCAQFYVAGTVYAFEHLHHRKIVFRDLKPENLLLSDTGQVKLTDLGLARVIVGRTYTTCGTPDYFAPELLDSRGHSFGLDWWTLGIFTYELMAGHPPFESATPMQIYQKVSKGIERAPFPVKFGKPLESLVKALCHSEPAKRLPCKKGGTNNIKTHPWYAATKFDWDKMFECKLTPPYIPTVTSNKDNMNFNARKEDMPPTIEYEDPKNGWDNDFATGQME